MLQDILSINPVLLTGIASSFVAVCGALGLKELFAKAYDRYCNKADEADSDHKELQQVKADVQEMLEILKEIKANEQIYMDNDMLVIANDILILQRKSLLFGKVSKSCYPWYIKLYNRYMSLNKDSEMDVDTEIEMNHRLIEQMLANGDVVEDFRELYK